MSRATRLSAAALATALGFTGLLLPASSAFAASTPAAAAETSAPVQARGTANVIQFSDTNLNSRYDEGEPDFQPDYMKQTLTLQNKETGAWYSLLPSALKNHGLPEGEYTLYLKDNKSLLGNHVFVDPATGKRMPRVILPTGVRATRIADNGKEYTNGVTAGYGGHFYQDITLKAGQPLELKYAASMIGVETSAVETVDGSKVDATDKLTVDYRDGSKKVNTTLAEGRLFAGDGSKSYTRYHFTDDTIQAVLRTPIDYAVKSVEAHSYQTTSLKPTPVVVNDNIELNKGEDGLTYSIARADAGDSWGQIAIEATLAPIETGKVNFRLFRDENLDSRYSGEAEEIHSGYVNLVDADGRWFKVTPESLAKQGLPAGTFTAYMRNAGIADGFGATVDSATGKRLETVRLDEKHAATYVDPNSGQTVATVTDTGRFAKATLTVKAGETIDADYANTRIDASAQLTTKKGEYVNPDEAVESVYFKDGDTKLGSFRSGEEFLAAADPNAKTRHFFTGEWITVGVEPKAGYRVQGVSAVPAATSGGTEIKAKRVSKTEYRIKRSELGDDFGRFEFSIDMKKHPKGK